MFLKVADFGELFFNILMKLKSTFLKLPNSLINLSLQLLKKRGIELPIDR